MIFADLETYGAEPIKGGAYRYAEQSEIMLFAWAENDRPVNVWDLTSGEYSIDDVRRVLEGAERTCWHNSAFDRTVLRRHGVTVPLEKITDTMVLALQHGLPGSLGQLCEVLEVPVDQAKDKDGKKLIQLFTKPRPKNMKLRRATRETHPDEWLRFIEYARLDVDAMRAVRQRLPRWNDTPSERRFWHIDQATNDFGIAVDTALARSALRAFDRASGALAALTSTATGGAVGATTQRNKLLAYLRDTHDFETLDLTKKTVETILRDGTLDPSIRDLLEIRQQAAATSPAKYKALLGAVSSDGRLRGTLQFCGAARTGRDAGRIFQPQNLPRTPDWFDEDVQAVTIRAIKADCEDIIWTNISERCSMSVRGCLLAAEGHTFAIADLSNIEGRVLAWGAGEEWKLEAFRAYDRGEGHDLYKVTAGRILGKDPSEVTKEERQLQGKTPELAGGYQGGVGAYRVMGGPVFEAMSDEAIQDIVLAWRAAHPRTKAFWYDLERACKQAIRNPGDAFAVRDMAVFDVVPDQTGRDWLRMKLPSGRYLCYPDPAIDHEDCERCDGAGEFPFVHEAVERIMKCPHCGGSGKQGYEEISYSGTNQYTRKWTRLTTYGGKLCIAQGTPVLTRHGWVPIEHVSVDDAVWDGVDWVSHEGSTCNGVKEVIKAHGVWMTPDHEVLTTEGWRCASQSEGFDRADARVPDSYRVRREQRTEVAMDDAMRVRDREVDGRFRVPQETTPGGAGFLRVPEVEQHIGPEDVARDVETQSVCSLARSDSALYQPEAPRLGQLRRTWRTGVRAVVSFVQQLLGRYGADVPEWSRDRAAGQQRRVQPGELRVGDLLSAGPEQAHKCHGPDALGVADRSGRGGSRGAEPINGGLQSGQRLAGPHAAGPAGQRTAAVYDLINAGPRHRFVVLGDDGRALIVHNCENWTQAVARDVFFSGMVRAAKRGFKIVLRVHDELVAEVPKNGGLTWEMLSEDMATNPGWAAGLPLAAAGFEADRYRKD